MKYEDSKGRAVDITETEIEIGEGAYVVSAEYTDVEDDSSVDVPDDELQYLTDKYQCSLYEDAYSSKASRAYDSYKDSMKYGDD